MSKVSSPSRKSVCCTGPVNGSSDELLEGSNLKLQKEIHIKVGTRYMFPDILVPKFLKYTLINRTITVYSR